MNDAQDQLEKLLREGWRIELTYNIHSEKFQGRVFSLYSWRDITTYSPCPIEALDSAIEAAVMKSEDLYDNRI